MERPLLIAAYYCEFQHTAAKVMPGAGVTIKIVRSEDCQRGLSHRASGATTGKTYTACIFASVLQLNKVPRRQFWYTLCPRTECQASLSDNSTWEARTLCLSCSSVEGGGLQNEEGRQKRACERITAKACAACSLRQFSRRTKYRGASSSAPPAREQSARFHYQIAQPSRPEPCAQAVHPSKRPVWWGAHLRSRSFHYHNHLFPLLVVVL